MKINQPVFIIGSYRGGTSLLFRLLSESKELWSLYRESNHLWQKFHRHPDERSDTTPFIKNAQGLFTNPVTQQFIENLDDERQEMDRHYHYSSYNSYTWGYLGRVKFFRERLSWIFNAFNFLNYLFKKLFYSSYRLIDKTPPNMYRVSLLAELYPDAKFIYLERDKQANTKSLIDAWCHKSKFRYPYRKYLSENLQIKNYSGDVWKFFIPLDWQDFLQSDIEEVCAHQYDDAHASAQKAFADMDRARYVKVQFEDLLAKPDETMQKLCDFSAIEYSESMKKIVSEMPAVNTDKLSAKISA